MLCISTVSARATGEIKSTWLGDVALIPGGGERGRGTQRGSRRERRRRRWKKKGGKAGRAAEVEEGEGNARGLSVLFPGCHFSWPGAPRWPLDVRKRCSMQFNGALGKKSLSAQSAYHLPHSDTAGSAVLTKQDTWLSG